MAPPKSKPKSKAPTSDHVEAPVGLEAAFRRIANLLALSLVKGESETQKVQTLTAVGFSVQEIAQLLNKEPNTVSAALYKARKASS